MNNDPIAAMCNGAKLFMRSVWKKLDFIISSHNTCECFVLNFHHCNPFCIILYYILFSSSTNNLRNVLSVVDPDKPNIFYDLLKTFKDKRLSAAKTAKLVLINDLKKKKNVILWK